MPTTDAKASVLFNRQLLEELDKGKTAKKSEPCSCLSGCLKGVLDSLTPGARGHASSTASDFYTERQPLAELEEPRPWSDLSEQERGGVTVVHGTCAKEDVRGWTNQDSLLACVPVSSKGDGAEGGMADDNPWDSYDAYTEQSTAPASEEATAGAAVQHILLGVLDGHGRMGHQVSQLAAKRIPGHWIAQPDCRRDPGKALVGAVTRADSDVYKEMASNVEYNGSTAVIICMDNSKKMLHCANVGDSRAVLGRFQKKDAMSPRWEAIPLTRDIKPDLPNEKERIEMSGGVVSAAKSEDGECAGPTRVWEDWTLTKPGLAMGRSIGDGCARRIGIIAEPEISSHKLRSDDRFVIIASDGLWDALSNEEAVSIAARHLESPQAAPGALIDAAREKQEGELEDDTTIVMVVFKA